MRKIASIKLTEHEDVKDLVKEEREKVKEDAVLGFYENDVRIPIIAKALKITEERVHEIIKTAQNKK